MFAQKKVEIKEGLQFTKSDIESLPASDKARVLKVLKWEGAGFDIRVDIKDPATGVLLKYQPYRKVVSQDHGSYYIRKDERGVERRYTEHGHLLDAQIQQVESDTKLPQ